MELRRVEAALGVLHRGDRADRREGRDREALRCLGDVVRVAHPADALLAHTGKELRCLARLIERDFRLAVLTRRRRLDLAAEQMGHELRAVADAEHWDAELEDLGAAGHGVFRVDAVRATRQDDALRRHLADLFQRKRLRMDFTVDMVLAHAARDELIVLATEVQHEDHFIYRLAQFCSSQIKNLLFSNYIIGAVKKKRRIKRRNISYDAISCASGSSPYWFAPRLPRIIMRQTISSIVKRLSPCTTCASMLSSGSSAIRRKKNGCRMAMTR